MIFLLASATSRFDKTALAPWEAVARFALALLLIAPAVAIHLPAAGLALGLVVAHHLRPARAAAA
jgi:hypothetical protein